MTAKKAVVAGARWFAGESPAPVITQSLSVGVGSGFDVNIDGTGVFNLLEIYPGMHLLDINVWKKDGLADSGTGTTTLTLGDTGDADRFFADTNIKPDASGWASLKVDGVTKDYRYNDTTPEGQYIAATVGGSDPTDGEFLVTFMYVLEKGVSTTSAS